MSHNSTRELEVEITFLIYKYAMLCILSSFFSTLPGCSGIPNDTIFGYHAGFTDDIKLFLEKMREKYNNVDSLSTSPPPPLFLSAFSLGSNVVLKCLGEIGVDAVEKYNIHGCAVTGSPFSLVPHWRMLIDNPFQRNVYTKVFVKSMHKKVENALERFCDGDKDTKVFDSFYYFSYIIEQ